MHDELETNGNELWTSATANKVSIVGLGVQNATSVNIPSYAMRCDAVAGIA
jgi:hypothetical protein